jgi:RNA polymerase sigma-70 factor (ECF subfamily)
MADREVTFSGQEETETVQDFDAIVHKYQDRIFNTVSRLVSNHEDALDITQEVFLKAYKALRSFRGCAGVYTWLYRIAVNTALSHRRVLTRRAPGRTLSLNDGEDPDERVGRRVSEALNPGTGELVSRKEVQERIKNAILSLDGELRSVVVLRDIEGLGYDDIAKVLRLPHGTVKSRLHRGRLILRDKLLDLVQAEGKSDGIV